MSHSEDEFSGRPHLVRQQARAMFWRKMLDIMIIALLATTLVLVVMSIRASSEGRDTVVDCTNPAGNCYQQGQKRTGDLIQELIDHMDDNSALNRKTLVLAIYCDGQPGVDTYNDLLGCVHTGLKQLKSLKIDPSTVRK